MVLEGGVLVSESFSHRHGVEAGDALNLITGEGPRRFPVAGVYYDYGSDRGTVLMERAVYERFWSDRHISALGLYLREGAAVTEVIEALRRDAAASQQLRIRSNRELREASLAIFDRTFTITRVLRLLAVGVAFIAVISALMAIQLERAREFAVLRAAGLTPGQLWRLMLGQTALMGGIASALALPVGLILAWVLTEVINRQSFGWSIAWRVTAADLGNVVLLGLAAALLAAIYPAWRIARTPPALALRDE
jgi:putative ABC transport system permease protein